MASMSKSDHPDSDAESTPSESSSYHSAGSPKEYTFSVNLWGRYDMKDNGSNHWGTMLYWQGEKTGGLYEVRDPAKAFQYEPKDHQPLELRASAGRCELSHLSERGRNRAEQLLDQHGNDQTRLPSRPESNCQNWVAGAVKVLEEKGLVPSGAGAFWHSQIGRRALSIGRDLQAQNDRNGHWILAGRKDPESLADAEDAPARRTNAAKVGKAAPRIPDTGKNWTDAEWASPQRTTIAKVGKAAPRVPDTRENWTDDEWAPTQRTNTAKVGKSGPRVPDSGRRRDKGKGKETSPGR